jgi:hypothetical protein
MCMNIYWSLGRIISITSRTSGGKQVLQTQESLKLDHDEIMRYLFGKRYTISGIPSLKVQVNPRVHSLLLIIPILASIVHYG